MSDHPNQSHHQHHHQQQQRRSWSRGSPSPIHYRPPSPWAPSPPILASPGGLRFTGRGSPASPMFGSHEQRGSRGPHLQHPRPRRPEHESSPARPPSVPPHYQSLERQSPATVMYQRPALRQASPAGFMSPPIYREFEYAAEPPPPGTLPTPQAYIIYDDEEDTGPTTAEIIANQSQDYIDEKLAQYQTTILQLQDEQERVQKKTFVNWINSYLSKRVPPLRVDDLIHDLKDGTKLLALLEVLSGERLPVEKGRVLRRPHFLSNANTALQFLASKRIKLVNINPSDLVDGRPPVVLGLIWTIILYFQIEENSRALEYLGHGLGGSLSSLDSAGVSTTPTDAKAEKWRQGARNTLLQWVTNALPRDSGIEVKDFGASWRDGIAFLALIDSIKTNLVNIAEMRKESNKTRLNTAFDVAEAKLGIARILDAEDVDVEKPDEKSIMTYVAQFLHKYPEPRKQSAGHETTIQQEYNDFMRWLQERTSTFESLIQEDRLSRNFSDYLNADSENKSHQPLYKKFLTLTSSRKNILGVPHGAHEMIQSLWEKLERQMLYWLWSLDLRLPGNFKIVGKWLCDAETLLMNDEIPTAMNEETASIISRKLEEHKQFFADYPNIMEVFQKTKSFPLDSSVNPEEIALMERRLYDVGPKATQRRIRLKFLEHKCCLIAFLNLVENKLKLWTAKCGRQEKVQQLLDQYSNFVSRNKIFQEFSKAFVDMQQVVEEYKRDGNITKDDVEEIEKFMQETEARWTSVSMELRCAQNMLEEVIAYWKRWNLLTSEFIPWLGDAEVHVQKSEDERLEFFQDIGVWREKYQLIVDTGNFLAGSCEDDISVELKRAISDLTSRWERLFGATKHYVHAGDILKNRQEYRNGLEKLSNWLRYAEQVLQNQSLGTTEEIKKYGEALQKLQSEIEDIEELFKHISKVFQTLIQDLSREEVDKNMGILKKEKEALVRVRAMIPSRLHLFHQLLVQHESLESGQREISEWLNEAETLLSSLSLAGGRDHLNSELNRHKLFFTRTLYYKSMLESKNKVFQNVLKSVTTEKNIDCSEAVDRMKELNERFEYVTKNAQQWENRLNEAVRCWRNFRDNERVIVHWLSQAEVFLSERPMEVKEVIETQKLFFDTLNERWMNELVQSAQDLLKCLPVQEQQIIVNGVEGLQERWKNVLSAFPYHLLNLEFRVEENNFNQYLKDVEKEVNLEQQALINNEDVDMILRRNQDFFKMTGSVGKIEKCLENMQRITAAYNQNHPSERHFADATENALKRWSQMTEKIEGVKKMLHKIPAQWDQYHQKFQEMIIWMDSVDESLKNITTEVDSMEEFERERVVFQKICHDADSKRENMKWLVKCLDSLLPYASESEAAEEQKKLEMMIARYKNLIPTIEVTMVRTEIFSKCYTYRREVREIVTLLNKVRDQTLSAQPPESLAQVNKMVQEQQYAINQLDQQRPNIVSMLQRGKDLSKDVHAPSFVTVEVKSLESGWKEAYNESIDKLKTLKDTQQVWNEYTDQKSEIINLLGNAETELRSITPLQTDPKNVSSDLKAKRDLNAHLQHVSKQMIERLRELSENLIPLTATEKQPQLSKDVAELEKQFSRTMDHVKERVEYLEDYSHKWNDYKERLAELQAWAAQTAPQLIESLQSVDLTPEEKTAKMMSIQQMLSEKMRQLDLLGSDASDLAPKEGNMGEAKRLKNEVHRLQETFSAISRNFENKSNIIQHDLTNWQKYQAELKEIKPQIENIEIKMNVSAPKPVSLQEAVLLQQQAKQFEVECENQLGKLQNAAVISQNLSCKTNAPDELDSINSRWNSVHENAKQQRNKIDKLVSNWQSFDCDATKLETWINDTEKVIQKRPKILQTPQIEKLEKELIKLKSYNNEISEHQAKLMALTQNSDNIAISVAPEGASALKERLNVMKQRIGNLSEGVRDKINEIMDAIMSRQDFNTQLAEFSNWIGETRTKALQTDDITTEKLEYAAQIVHELQQDSADKKPMFNKIYNEVKSMVLEAAPEDATALNEAYTSLVSDYQELDTNLEQKRKALEKWRELLGWLNETNSHLEHIQHQLESPESKNRAKLESILAEIDDIAKSVSEWKGQPHLTEELSCLQVRDKTTRNILNLPQLFNAVETKLDGLKAKTVDQIDTSEKQTKQKDNFASLEKSFVDNLNEARAKLTEITATKLTPSNLEHVLNELVILGSTLKNQSPMRQRIHDAANTVMSADISGTHQVQEALLMMDREWENLNQEIADRIANYRVIYNAMKEYVDAKDRFSREMGKAVQMANLIPVDVADEENIIHASEASKKSLEFVRKCKAPLDELEKKSSQLLKLFETPYQSQPEEVVEVVDDAHKQYQAVLDNVAQKAKSFETESALWKQIDLLKNELFPWLSDTNQNLCDSAKNIQELEHSAVRLNKYKNELPHYTSLKNELCEKIEQLKELKQEDLPILGSLVSSVEDQFNTVENNAKHLEAMAQTLNAQEKEIRTCIKLFGEAVNKIREALIKCDDMSGDTTKIIERIKTCDILKQELTNCGDEISHLASRVAEMQEIHPSIANSIIPKELNNVQKRYESVQANANKIEETLLQFLKKLHADKIDILRRMIGTQKEKISWCLPEPGSDKYNLEVKKAALNDIQRSIGDIEIRDVDLKNSLKLLENIAVDDSLKKLIGEHDNLVKELEELKENCGKTRDILLENVTEWEDYEKASESIISTVKQIEGDLKDGCATQINLATIDNTIGKIKSYKATLEDVAPKLQQLEQLAKVLNEKNPEARPTQVVSHLGQKYTAVLKQVANQLTRHSDVKANGENFNKNLEECRDWLKNTQEAFNVLSTELAKSETPKVNLIDQIKSMIPELDAGRALIDKLNDSGESLCSVTTSTNRESIRNDIKSVRDDFDKLHNDVATTLKNLEGILIQKASLEENITQTSQWLADSLAKIPEELELGTNLAEKKTLLQKYKTQLKDIEHQKQNLNRLKAKTSNLADKSLSGKVSKEIAEFDKLSKLVKGKIEVYSNHVQNHECYDEILEKASDWFVALKVTAVDVLEADKFEKEATQEKRMIIENVLEQEPEGDAIFDTCFEKLQSILPETHPNGHEGLLNTCAQQKMAWKEFIDQCREALKKHDQKCSQLNELQNIVENCDKWLKQMENIVKDQSLKNGLEAKEQHLNNLKNLANEISGKSAEIAEINEKARHIENEPELALKISRLNTRCQAVKNSCKDSIGKYENYTKDHKDFNAEYDSFKASLEDTVAKLNENSEVVGDLEVLQERLNKIKELADKRILDSSKFESIIEKGEKLYTHTSPDGREIIRQRLRNLRTMWDDYTDDLNSAIQKLEQCLLQFGEFTLSQEQLTKWLKDVEKSMQNHMELKSTLQEKKAQLQNHRLMHQEILSHHPLVESVCDKAQHLVDQTKDSSLNHYFESIKQLFENIVQKSEELMANLENCVQIHNNYSILLANFKSWLNNEKELALEADDITGEKSEGTRRMNILDQLQKNIPIGANALKGLKENIEIVGKSTSSEGKKVLQSEVADLENAFEAHIANIESLKAKQAAVLSQWQQFDGKLEELTNWCRGKETIFKVEHLQPSLETKEDQLKTFIEERNAIVEKQKDFDEFVDISHSLQGSSGTERIKTLTMQLLNRYQLLQVLSKEVVNRWQGLVEDHRKYDNKMREVLSLIIPIENKLTTLDSPESLADNLTLLQSLIAEKEATDGMISSLIPLGEKILPDTLGQGREKIRQELRDVRDRWDSMEEHFKDLQKRQQSQNMQWSNYKDTLQQAIQWLDVVEKGLQKDQASVSTTNQEIKAKLMKLKSTGQDISAHKRLIEVTTEKANQLLQMGSVKEPEEIKNVVDDINNRYSNAQAQCSKLLGQLEKMSDIFQIFSELHKAQQDYQKNLWDSLATYSDFSGNKATLQSRLGKLNEIGESLQDSEAKLNALGDHLRNNEELIHARSKENMSRDLANLRFDFEKFKSALGDVKSGLESKIAQWSQFDSNMEQLLEWMSDSEISLKNYSLKSTLGEKQEQLTKYRDLLKNLQQHESNLDNLTDESSELIQGSGEVRLSGNIQQIISRFQSVQTTAKEIVKKCEQAVQDHEIFNDKYKQCSDWLSSAQVKYQECQDLSTAGSQEDLMAKYNSVQELLSQNTNATLLLNNTIELGEKLYQTTALEGREAIREQLQELQLEMEKLFDNLGTLTRALQTKLSKWSGFEECSQNLDDYLTNMEAQLSENLILKSTLDEKRIQLQNYRDNLTDIQNHKPEMINLKDLIENLPEQNETIENQCKSLEDRYGNLLKLAQKHLESYVNIVNDHQLYCKAVMDTQEFIEAAHNTVNLWGDLDVDRVSLASNLDRLKKVQQEYTDETSRINEIRSLGERVLPGTAEEGQVNVKTQVDNSQQEWEALVSSVQNAIDNVMGKLQQWDEYEKLRDQCVAWISGTDSKLHAIDLKTTKAEKIEQLEALKELQGEVRAKELEIDSVTERAQLLYKGLASSRSSQISELVLKYQQVCLKVKELHSRWQQYVSGHQEFDNKLNDCNQWLDNIKQKLDYCSDLSATSPKDLENKLATIQDLLLLKDEGFGKVQSVIETAQNVLANTAPAGHEAINKLLTKLQEDWSNLALRMIDVKTSLDESINQWSGFLEEVQNVNKTVDWMENAYKELCDYQATMTEKRAMLERIKNAVEKIRLERMDVDILKAKAKEMIASGQQSLAANQAQQILDKFDLLSDKMNKLMIEREEEYRDHRLYKEAYDDLSAWMARARDKFPSLKQQTLSDKLAIENILAPLEALLNKQPQGELLVEHLQHTSEVVLASTSEPGQEVIRRDIAELRENFESMFREIAQQKDQLESTVIQWRDYKEEYERLSEWLQQIDILVKNHKLNLLATLPEKQKQVKEMDEILQRLEKGREDIEKFNKSAAPLLASHLDTYVNNQLRHLNSRFQVQVNLAKDVYKKVETNYEQHKEFDECANNARNWIENAKEIIRECSEASSSSNKETLQQKLQQITDLIRRREEGQNLVHTTVNNGEKVLRSTRSDGKDVINNQIKEIQNEWDRLVKKMSTVKVHLETSLLQWADYSSSYSQLQQWISDREAKLQQVCEQKVAKSKKGQPGLASGLSERKANLRQTNNIVQDIVSFEPMIQSVTSKASDLQQAVPASEISFKYENLSKQAKDLYEKQKETIENHQALIDAGNDFAQWLRNAKERLSKSAEPIGDRDTLTNKLGQIRMLQNEVNDEGTPKLNKVLEQGEIACRNAVPIDREIIEEEVALLQEEFDNFVENLKQAKQRLEIGIVKWTEYDDQYKEALDWLTKTETLVQSYNKLQDSLEEKKNVLEQFQNHLQTIFDWQRELDQLNITAQTLLEICADTRISNGVTQLTTKYNALLSIAKEVMRRLELHYQEHQQHQALYGECQDWVEAIRDKLNECLEVPNTIAEVNHKLNTIQNIKQLLEQGQNKLRYTIELKEKVIMNTEINGAAKIQENTENLKHEFEKLISEIGDIKQKLTNRAAQLDDVMKLIKILNDWLDEVEPNLQLSDACLNELSEKKTWLEKNRTLQKDMITYNDTIEKVKNKLKDDESLDKKAFDECLKRFENCQGIIAKNIENLENQVKYHENYKMAYGEIAEWIRKTKMDIQHCSDSHGDKPQLLEKQTKLREIELSQPEGKILMENTVELSGQVIATSGREGQDVINQEIKQLKSDWDGLQLVTKQSHDGLTNCIAMWNKFTEKSDQIAKWLQEYEAKINQMESAGEITTNDLTACKKILEDVQNQRENMEDLSDCCEILMEQSACTWVRDKTVDLQGRYSNLLNSAQAFVSKAEKCLADQTNFLVYKEQMEKWIAGKESTIKECTMVGNEATTRQNLNSLNNVYSRLPEGQSLFVIVQDAFTKTLSVTPSDRQPEIQVEMDKIQETWDKLNKNVNDGIAKAKSNLMRWEDYRDSKNKFEKWITDVEATLNANVENRGDLSEMKTLQERFKNIKGDIQAKKSDLDHIQSEAKELSSWSKTPNEIEDANHLVIRWDHLNAKCDSMINGLQTEIDDYLSYHQSLQETEKWLLQVSFQLMAHNSLYITNREQTQEQLNQHEILLDEIQKYQTNLDDLKAKGNNQISRYEHCNPYIKNTIETHLKNVQDSYNSLLLTSIQIKKRLEESMAKFKEYEDTLEDIQQQLIKNEAIMPPEEVPSDLETSKSQLKFAQELYSGLQREKGRLAAAVAACESATASISRPSSPIETAMQPIPEKELKVRAQLEDQIDQIQTYLGDLVKAIAELELLEKQRNELDDWINKQQAIVSDWLSRPSKLRSDGAKQELAAMNDLLTAIGDKRSQLLTEMSGPLEGDDETTKIEERLDKLEDDLMAAIAKKKDDQGVIDEYRKCTQATHGWIDEFIQRMDVLDSGSGLSCSQKLATIQKIREEFESASPGKLAAFKDIAGKTIEVISNLDAQQVEEQIKGIDRRFNDISKRINRKIQVIESTNKGLENLKNDIDNCHNWIKSSIEELGSPEDKGQNADVKLAHLKNQLKQAEGKQPIIETLEKRLNNIQSELEPIEVLQLQTEIQNLKADEQKLKELLKAEIGSCGKEIQLRKAIDENLEKAEEWLKVNKPVIERENPLSVADLEAKLHEYKKHEADLKEFKDGVLSDLDKQSSALFASVPEQEKDALRQKIQQIRGEFDGAKKDVSSKVNELVGLVPDRQKFEDALKGVTMWLSETEVSTSSPIRTTNLPTLEEQLAKYKNLSRESQEIRGTIGKITDEAANISQSLTPGDKQKLTDQLKSVRDRYDKVANLIDDRLKYLEKHIKEYLEAKQKVTDYIQFMGLIQAEIKNLNKPVGSKIEDVQELLQSYEKILSDLKDSKAKIGEIQVENLPELQTLVTQQDDTIQLIEDQLARLRQLLLLREQFIALVNEIMTFIKKYTGVVTDIEKSGDSIEDKIAQYDGVILKIQECEAILASAADKGNKIASEGTAADRNSITEQLQSLKMQLQNLRKLIESQKQKHENTLAEHRKMQENLSSLLDWLHQNETQVKSRPLLNRDPNCVEREIQNHHMLRKKIEKNLDEIQKINDQARNEVGLPGSLLEMLSESRLLLTTLPAELNDREEYLQNNKKYRLDYLLLVSKLNSWLEEVEVRLQNSKHGINFENIAGDLEEHKLFFGTEPMMTELVTVQIQEAADKIWSSLNNSEQNDLSKELQHHKQVFKNTVSAAKSHQNHLEENLKLWKEYCECYEKVNNLIERSKLPEESVENLGALNFILQKVNHALNDVQAKSVDVDALNEKAQIIKRFADADNLEKIEWQQSKINENWNNLIVDLKRRKDYIGSLLENWEQLDKKTHSLETQLSHIGEQCKLLDPVVRSRKQLEDSEATLQDLAAKIDNCRPLCEELSELADTVHDLLQRTNPACAKGVEDTVKTLNESHKILHKAIKDRVNKNKEALEWIKRQYLNIVDLQNQLRELKGRVVEFYVFGENLDQTENNLRDLRKCLSDKDSEVKKFIKNLRDNYTNSQNFIPTDIAQELTTLELMLEQVHEAMEDKMRDFKKARTVRSEYLTNVDEIQKWISGAEDKINNHEMEPAQFKDILQKLNQEHVLVGDRLNYVRKNGQVIIDHSQNDEEKGLIEATVDQLAKQLDQIGSLLAEKRKQVENTLDGWSRFLHLYQQVMDWVKEKGYFLAEPLDIVTLQQARQKAADYAVAVKSVKPINKNLSEMDRELEQISELTTVGELRDKLQEAEDSKAVVEGRLLERNGLLQETCEEWEQCERKMKEVRAWIDKTKSQLESPQQRKKPLRDQLGIHEKTLADISTQKTKIHMSIEKLQVHFRELPNVDSRILEAANEIVVQLDELRDLIRQRTRQIEETLHQIDLYQQNIQSLRQKVIHEEQQLRHILSPSYLAHERDRAAAEEQACRERIKSVQVKLNARNERIKLLIQRGTPDTEMLLDT
ncbi:muscle-specific protein 300 kDa isoform X7 [Phlebotomus papatasi]|uniref:muscle-specific protein 300 kDa isoform X7 n=1 Tax=Phlebotomus papatasi TaxID=29031 RepID=UPI00248369A1|nr:muscle-specific protein 300 kDa isoform X7 [Phlebotomus papatasi]